MEVKKMGYIQIPPSFFVYYTLKTKYLNSAKELCPKCKKGPLSFIETNRTLTVTCVNNKDCKNNMSIPVHTYVTHDSMYEKIKQEYKDSVNTILREKFDIMFNYKKPADISEIRNTYLNCKMLYNNVQQQHYDRLQSRKEKYDKLMVQHDELMGMIKSGKGEKNIQVDLNAILNEIRRLAYVKVGDEVILDTDFDREILII